MSLKKMFQELNNGTIIVPEEGDRTIGSVLGGLNSAPERRMGTGGLKRFVGGLNEAPETLVQIKGPGKFLKNLNEAPGERVETGVGGFLDSLNEAPETTVGFDGLKKVFGDINEAPKAGGVVDLSGFWDSINNGLERQNTGEPGIISRGLGAVGDGARSVAGWAGSALLTGAGVAGGFLLGKAVDAAKLTATVTGKGAMALYERRMKKKVK